MPWNITTGLNQKPQVMFTVTSVGQELHARTACREGQYISEQRFQLESVWTGAGETCHVTRVPVLLNLWSSFLFLCMVLVPFVLGHYLLSHGEETGLVVV